MVEAGLFVWLADRRLPRVWRLDRQRSVPEFLLVSVTVSAVGGMVVAVGLQLVGSGAQSL